MAIHPAFLDSRLPVDASAADSLAIVMPAYREEENLATTVRDFLRTAETLGVPHCVVVVNDGSSDRTGEIADRLAADYRGRVIAVHHEVNRGYGPAVATGIKAALERLDTRWLFLTDSDGQFKADDLVTFLDEARNQRADAVLGFRPHRADPWHRKVNAYLWTRLSGLLLPIGVRDVDCAYKLIDRRLLREADFKGSAATISPEIVSHLRMQGARIIERPVQHYPREHGQQTGAKLSVILRSLVGLAGLALSTAGKRAPGRLARRVLRQQDMALAFVTLAAAVASAAAYAYFISTHSALAYPDAVSHLLIARRVLFASTPGLAQLGAVWLPLPHLLSLPFVWVSSWYYSGFAESIVSMAAYVVSVRYVYLITRDITDNRGCAVVAAVFFGANPNMLYLQSTGMSEQLMIATIAASAYYLVRWAQTGRYTQLGAAAIFGLAAGLTRYEGWVYCLAATAVVLYVAWMRPRDGKPTLLGRYRSMEAHLIYFAVIALSGIVGWVIWNAIIFGDPLYFQTGPFAKPSLWVSSSDPNIGHLLTSARTYLYAMVDNAGAPALALAAVGLLAYLIRNRLRAESLPVLVLLVFAVFYVYALYSGQRPMDVTQIQGDLYNVRFGILMVLPVAVFIGYLSRELSALSLGWLRIAGFTAAVLAGAACSLLVARGGIDTYIEAKTFQQSPVQQAEMAAGSWLRSHYTGGKVLMESFGNETATYASRLPLGNVIYEGSFRQWQPALAAPLAQGIRWIFMRDIPGSQDEVYTALNDTVQLSAYHLVYSASGEEVYEIKSAMWASLRQNAGLGVWAGSRAQIQRSRHVPTRAGGHR